MTMPPQRVAPELSSEEIQAGHTASQPQHQ